MTYSIEAFKRGSKQGWRTGWIVGTLMGWSIAVIGIDFELQIISLVMLGMLLWYTTT